MSGRTSPGGATLRTALQLLIRGALAVIAWWALVEGETGGVLMASLFIASAAVVSYWLSADSSGPISPGGLLRFVPWFATQSLRGGIDVARRAIDPRLPISPGFVELELTLPPGTARRLLTGIVSLLPGTLSVALDEHAGGPAVLRLHVLDTDLPIEPRFRELEQHLARILPKQ